MTSENENKKTIDITRSESITLGAPLSGNEHVDDGITQARIMNMAEKLVMEMFRFHISQELDGRNQSSRFPDDATFRKWSQRAHALALVHAKQVENASAAFQ